MGAQSFLFFFFFLFLLFVLAVAKEQEYHDVEVKEQLCSSDYNCGLLLIRVKLGDIILFFDEVPINPLTLYNEEVDCASKVHHKEDDCEDVNLFLKLFLVGFTPDCPYYSAKNDDAGEEKNKCNHHLNQLVS